MPSRWPRPRRSHPLRGPGSPRVQRRDARRRARVEPRWTLVYCRHPAIGPSRMVRRKAHRGRSRRPRRPGGGRRGATRARPSSHQAAHPPAGGAGRAPDGDPRELDPLRLATPGGRGRAAHGRQSRARPGGDPPSRAGGPGRVLPASWRRRRRVAGARDGCDLRAARDHRGPGDRRRCRQGHRRAARGAGRPHRTDARGRADAATSRRSPSSTSASTASSWSGRA